MEIIGSRTPTAAAGRRGGHPLRHRPVQGPRLPLCPLRHQRRVGVPPRAVGVGPGLRRLRGFQGRSDQMVKLRGINVYPTAIGAHLRRASGGHRRIRLPARAPRGFATSSPWSWRYVPARWTRRRCGGSSRPSCARSWAWRSRGAGRPRRDRGPDPDRGAAEARPPRHELMGLWVRRPPATSATLPDAGAADRYRA